MLVFVLVQILDANLKLEETHSIARVHKIRQSIEQVTLSLHSLGLGRVPLKRQKSNF